jgi:hypothetical protein
MIVNACKTRRCSFLSEAMRVALLIALIATAAGMRAGDEDDALATLEILETPEALQELIDSDVVSLVLFVDEEETEESKWFEMFASFFWQGTRIAFGVCNNNALKQAGRTGAQGIYLFHRSDSFDALQLPMRIANEPEAREAMRWILGALAGAQATEERGAWRKAAAAPDPIDSEKSEL